MNTTDIYFVQAYENERWTTVFSSYRIRCEGWVAGRMSSQPAPPLRILTQKGTVVLSRDGNDDYFPPTPVAEPVYSSPS